MLCRVIVFFFLLILPVPTWAVTSEVTRFPTLEVYGKGPLPYNYRVIDENIHVGGHPLNPHTSFRNTDDQVVSILNYLVSNEVVTIIDLENTGKIQKRYKKLLKQAGIRRIHIPMHAFKTPNDEEWLEIKEAMQEPVYIHCKWGADRAGSIIGRYLVEVKGYSSQEAYEAVVTGGTHAGPIGGLKQGWQYRNLKRFFCP